MCERLQFVGLTDETPEATEQAKINISPFLFAMMVLVSKKEDKTNASNQNNGAC